jgi:hypothetical protein
MAEDVDDINDVQQVLEFVKKSSDAALMLNLITPYLMGERRAKLSKMNQDLIEVIQMLVINQMKLQNDLRSLLVYLNKKELLDTKDADAPVLKDVEEGKKDPNSLYC